MNTKTISSRALSVIDQYLKLSVGSATASVPYFNNKTVRSRAALRAFVGKGSPGDIAEEAQAIAIKKRIAIGAWTSSDLKKFLTDENLGIDCSGFAYYVLDAESLELRKGSIDKKLSFVQCSGLFAKMRCAMRPVENCGVETFAHDKNSRIIPLKEALPGDFVSLISIASEDSQDVDHDHIVVIEQIEYQNFVPTVLHYSHAVAYPEDGVYGTGVRKGTIEVTQPDKGILDQRWLEGTKEGADNRLFVRAKKSKTELRRLNWF